MSQEKYLEVDLFSKFKGQRFSLLSFYTCNLYIIGVRFSATELLKVVSSTINSNVIRWGLEQVRAAQYVTLQLHNMMSSFLTLCIQPTKLQGDARRHEWNRSTEVARQSTVGRPTVIADMCKTTLTCPSAT